jgi:predicted ATPase
MFKAHRAIAEALPGFAELFTEGEELAARFEQDGGSTQYGFEELSDGERTLIALHVILQAVAGAGKTLILDEPDNYLALREIQPWLAELVDKTLRTGGPQVILISHHPDALNFLAPEKGYRMFRERGGPTRIERFAPAAGLDAAGTVARGWDEPK